MSIIQRIIEELVNEELEPRVYRWSLTLEFVSRGYTSIVFLLLRYDLCVYPADIYTSDSLISKLLPFVSHLTFHRLSYNRFIRDVCRSRKKQAGPEYMTRAISVLQSVSRSHGVQWVRVY